MSDDYGITGYAELKDAMDAISYKLQRQYLMAGVRAGADVIAQEMSARAPVLDPSLSSVKRFSGELAANITYRIFNSDSATVTARIGPAKATFWGKFAELGDIHQPARPWMRPAADARASDAQDAIAASLREALGL